MFRKNTVPRIVQRSPSAPNSSWKTLHERSQMYSAIDERVHRARLLHHPWHNGTNAKLASIPVLGLTVNKLQKARLSAEKEEAGCDRLGTGAKHCLEKDMQRSEQSQLTSASYLAAQQHAFHQTRTSSLDKLVGMRGTYTSELSNQQNEPNQKRCCR